MPAKRVDLLFLVQVRFAANVVAILRLSGGFVVRIQLCKRLGLVNQLLLEFQVLIFAPDECGRAVALARLRTVFRQASVFDDRRDSGFATQHELVEKCFQVFSVRFAASRLGPGIHPAVRTVAGAVAGSLCAVPLDPKSVPCRGECLFCQIVKVSL